MTVTDGAWSRWWPRVGGLLAGAGLVGLLLGPVMADAWPTEPAISTLPAGCALLPEETVGERIAGARGGVIATDENSRECRWRTTDTARQRRTNPTVRLNAELHEELGDVPATERARLALYESGDANVDSALRDLGTEPTEGLPAARSLDVVQGIGDEAIIGVLAGPDQRHDERTVRVHVRRANVTLMVDYHAYGVAPDAMTRTARKLAREAVSRL